MRKSRAALGSVLFFVVGPATIAGLIPWWLTRWQPVHPLRYGAAQRVTGTILIVVGTGVLIHAFARFVVEGLGTPAPVAPTEHLVVGGLYRHVRNPMYLAVLLAIIGQAMVLGQGSLVLYALVVAVAFGLFVRLYEEPVLRSRFGAEYEAYRRAVPRWWPRLTPWRPGGRR
jgi:protein-S-isoprenylcysteine O-methyltransferase Ste14